MADPNQKSLDLPKFLTRNVPIWTTPQWMEADRWRRVVTNQPVAAICESTLIADLMDTHWEVRSKDPKEEDKLDDHIEHYTEVLNPDLPGGLTGFDIWASQMTQDMLTVPVGGNSEVVRFKNGNSPLNRPHKKGHVFKIVYMDGATLQPIYDNRFIMTQRLREDANRAVYFERNEVARLVMKPRVEIERWGYGMAPPEKVYLALTLLYRGDAYYANLLLDTPEAGLLDLIDMSKESAEQWLSSFRELLSGIDPFKVPVLYEHEKPAQFISFGRPPTELMYSETTLKYAQIVTAGYGLTLTDVGLGDPQKTLAGSIRDERRSRRSGFGVTKEKFRVMINAEILPDYLEFVWLENDEEAQIQRSRALLAYTQALKAAKEAGFIKPNEGQAELVKQGLLTVEVEEPEEQPAQPPPGVPQLPPPDAGKELDKKPPSEGGRGDSTAQAVEKAGDPAITAVPSDTSHFDELNAIMRHALDGIIQRMDRPQLVRLIKVATRAMFPDVNRAFVHIEPDDLPLWALERTKYWFEQKSEFDAYPDVLKQREDVLKALDKSLDMVSWWKIPVADILESIVLVFRMSFSEGAQRAAELVQQFLFTEGLRDTPSVAGIAFDLKNPRTLRLLEKSAAELVTRVNDGTKFYLKRIITSGVDEGLSSPNIAKMIAEGADVETILRQAGFNEGIIKRAQAEISAMSDYRLNSIVNTEINRAESMGRLTQWQKMGLTKKRWVHRGGDNPCPICSGNEAQGFVAMDHMFEDAFGGALTPPGHPGVCHCSLEFSEDELMKKADKLNIWTGR